MPSALTWAEQSLELWEPPPLAQPVTTNDTVTATVTTAVFMVPVAPSDDFDASQARRAPGTHVRAR
jgi:hypothetical protein